MNENAVLKPVIDAIALKLIQSEDLPEKIAKCVVDRMEQLGHLKEKPYLSIKDAAEKLNITKVTIHKWINNGTIKAEKIGGRTLILSESIQSALKPIEATAA